MRWMPPILLITTLVTIPPTPALGQTGRRSIPPVREGERVRFWTPQSRLATYGTVVSAAADSIAIGDTWTSLASVTRLQVQRHPSRSAVWGSAALGAGLGAAGALGVAVAGEAWGPGAAVALAAVGAGLGAYWTLPVLAVCRLSSCDQATTLVPLTVAVSGVVALGFGLRAARSVPWLEVPLEHVIVTPRPDGGVGIGASLTY